MILAMYDSKSLFKFFSLFIESSLSSNRSAFELYSSSIFFCSLIDLSSIYIVIFFVIWRTSDEMRDRDVPVGYVSKTNKISGNTLRINM